MSIPAQSFKAKTLISSYKPVPEWFGTHYNMNIYRGCCHGCIYCDSRSSCYGIQNFEQVGYKEGAVGMIRRELAGKKRRGVVGTGAMSDPYNPFEKQLQLTRGALAALDDYGFGVHVMTKSDGIVRDCDVLSAINSHAPVLCSLTITAADDTVAKVIEPGAASSSQRFKAAENLAAAGLPVALLMMPLLPFITDNEENIKKIISRAGASGVRFIVPVFGVTLRDRQRRYFYSRLDEFAPGMAGRYRALYGDTYMCRSPEAKALKTLFKEECRRHGLLYKMDDIIQSYQGRTQTAQLPLF
jgi:DNA repair photolyase